VWSTTSAERRRRCTLAGSRARSRIASMSVCSALVLAAGCGGAERNAIPAPTAAGLADRSERVAAALERGDRCEADRLADALLRASARARLPQGYRSPLLAAARSLAARIDCPPPPAPVEAEEEEEEEDEDDDDDEDDKHKGKGKKGRG
jgi:hypothetical protein